MDRRYDRRQFLRDAALGTAALSSLPVSLPILGAEEDERLQKLPPTTVEKDLTSVAPTAPVAIGRGRDFELPKLAELMTRLFDQIGGIRDLVSGKTVTVKLNTTGDGRRKLGGRSAARTYQVHPNMIEVLCGLLVKAGAQRVYLVESYYSTRKPEEILAGQGWEIGRLKSAGDQKVFFEDTRHRGAFKDYAKFDVPWGGYVYPAYHLNRRYHDTDVLVTIAKLKNHANAGYTGAVKNLFGIAPTALYGNDAPNENTTQNRGSNLHNGRKKPPAGVTQERYEGWPDVPRSVCSFHRVPRVTADLYGARPADLSIVEGIETCKGGEGPWIPGVRPIAPGLLLVGLNGVTTDAIGAAVMGYDPLDAPRTGVWKGDNHLALLAKAGIGTHDPGRIEVRGLALREALHEYEPGSEGWVKRHSKG